MVLGRKILLKEKKNYGKTWKKGIFLVLFKEILKPHFSYNLEMFMIL